jgi:hypothetical protein
VNPKTDISSRTVLRNTVIGAAALASGLESIFAAPRPDPPNIVFILADDLGYAGVAYYGRPDLHTPNIDALAARGTRFLQAYANSAVCFATRTVLITRFTSTGLRSDWRWFAEDLSAHD